jgi:hypothetical protein
MAKIETNWHEGHLVTTIWHPTDGFTLKAEGGKTRFVGYSHEEAVQLFLSTLKEKHDGEESD